MKTSYFIHLIADYGVGDPAFGEVIQKLLMLDSNLRVYPTSVPAFSTIATGFWIAQYGLYNPFNSLAIYSNTAPRKDKKEARENNAGEGLVYIKLTNNIPIVAVHAGYNLSFVKNHIKVFRRVNVSNSGSQFRSRDFYPEAVVKILNNNEDILGDDLDKNIIPDIPLQKIASIDGYGNIKTTIRIHDVNFSIGSKINVKIGKISHEAYFTNGSFSVPEGTLSISKGSTGGENGFLELFLRGGSAYSLFGRPQVEDDVLLNVR